MGATKENKMWSPRIPKMRGLYSKHFPHPKMRDSHISSIPQLRDSRNFRIPTTAGRIKLRASR